MITRLLVAVDAMPGSRLASRLAVEIAQSCGAAIAGLAVIDPYWGSQADFWMGEHEANRLLEDLRARAAAASVAVTTMTREADAPEAVLAEATMADLLVMGRDATFWVSEDWRPSSTVQTILRRAARPVLLAPLSESGSDHVLVAFDGSAASSRALHLFALLGLAKGRAIEVVSVGEERSDAELLARAAASLLDAHGAAAVEVTGLEAKAHPAEVILGHARRFDAGMVVMGAYGHRGLKDLVFGSTTVRLLQSCPASLFLHH